MEGKTAPRIHLKTIVYKKWTDDSHQDSIQVIR
jgi:hypothetical protein